MTKGKHYQACCTNKECSIHGTCASSIPHAVEDACYIKCSGRDTTMATTCSLIVTENDKITVVKSF